MIDMSIPTIFGSDQNRVTVRIWRATKLGIGRVGHVSLQTYVGGPSGNGIYASLWPPKDSGKAAISGVLAKHKSLEEDMIGEGTIPDQIINYYTLDPLAIGQTWVGMAGPDMKWAAIGGSDSAKAIMQYATNQDTRAHLHCASFVLRLLYAGGILNKREISGYSIDQLAFKNTTWVYQEGSILAHAKRGYKEPTPNNSYLEQAKRAAPAIFFAVAPHIGLSTVAHNITLALALRSASVWISNGLVTPDMLGQWCYLHQLIDIEQNNILLEPEKLIDKDPMEHDRQIYEELKKQRKIPASSKCTIL